jgi:hypothetical protein
MDAVGQKHHDEVISRVDPQRGPGESGVADGVLGEKIPGGNSALTLKERTYATICPF